MNPEQPKYHGIASAQPGWWAIYTNRESKEEMWAPIAAWVIFEDKEGLVFVDGIDPTGEGWDGTPCSETGNFVRYEYDSNRVYEFTRKGNP